MWVNPADYLEIPANPHGIHAGSLLLPTSEPIVQGGKSSLDFVIDQGGVDDTFIFLFGLRKVRNTYGQEIDLLEGVFLNEGGPGFHPTWGFQQLMRETELGGWKVIPTEEVLNRWVEKIERRMNN